MPALTLPALTLLAAPAVAAAATAALVAAGVPAAAPPLHVARATGVPASGNVSATVPVVAASREDGLDRVLPAGRHVLEVPVWEAPNGPAARVDGAVSGAEGRCSGVPLTPGGVVRLRCALVARPGQQPVVTVRARGLVVARYVHDTEP